MFLSSLSLTYIFTLPMFLCEEKMSGRDGQRQRRRRGRCRHSNGTENSTVDFEGEQPFRSRVRVPSSRGGGHHIFHADSIV